MKVAEKIFGFLFAMALIAAVAFGGYAGAVRFAALYARLDFQIALVTAIVTAALLLSAMALSFSIRRAGERSRESEVLIIKAQAYGLFVSLWEEVLNCGTPLDESAELSRKMQNANQLLALHGSAAAVKAHAAMQSMNRSDARTQFATALMGMRADLGVESRGLKSEELAELLRTGQENATPDQWPGVRQQDATPVQRPSVRQDVQPRVSLTPD